MRVVWQDTVKPKEVKLYRKHVITKHDNGWTVDIPGDNNIYRAASDVFNMLDVYLGNGTPRPKPPSRLSGIRIVGKLNA